MTAPEGLPPLTPAEAEAVLRRLGDLTSSIVLVGGQALAFWVDLYAERVAPLPSVNSKDIDFCGSRAAVATAAFRLGGTYKVPEPFDNTPNTGLVEFVDSHGYARWIDFLGDPFGLSYSEVADWAVEVEAPSGDAPVTFRVMHPVHCLKSRISNVGGLPGYQNAHALTQARAAVSCAREYLRDVLDAATPKAARRVLDLNEHIYRFAWHSDHARTTLTKHGIDAFEAVLVDDRLPSAFRTKRYPDMLRRLTWRRRPKGTSSAAR